MSEIVKLCKTHGELNLSQVSEYRSADGLTFSLKCKQCKKDYYWKNVEINREKSREYEKTRRKRPDGHYENYVKTKSREWRRENKDLVNSRVAEDRMKDPEKYREYDRKWRRENIERARFFDVIKKHNITYEKYMEMMEKQNGKCAICGGKEKRKSRTHGNLCRLAIDHNHSTGNIRELLCSGCNLGLGKFKDDIDLLKSAILYLEKHKCED